MVHCLTLDTLHRQPMEECRKLSSAVEEIFIERHFDLLYSVSALSDKYSRQGLCTLYVQIVQIQDNFCPALHFQPL